MSLPEHSYLQMETDPDLQSEHVCTRGTHVPHGQYWRCTICSMLRSLPRPSRIQILRRRWV